MSRDLQKTMAAVSPALQAGAGMQQSTMSINGSTTAMDANAGTIVDGSNNAVNIGAISTPAQVNEALSMLAKQAETMNLQAKIIARLLGMLDDKNTMEL